MAIRYEQYLPKNLAEVLKSLGYHEPTHKHWTLEEPQDKEWTLSAHVLSSDWNDMGDCYISAPTSFETVEWLREEHSLWVDACPTCDDAWSWGVMGIKDNKHQLELSEQRYKSFDVCLIYGISRALEVLKGEKHGLEI